MRGRTLTVRTIALLGAGSAAIHQLRYAIGYGEGANAALAAHPHGYLEALLPGVATAVVIALAATLARIGCRSNPDRRRSFVHVWAGCAIALAAIYGVQETLEGAGAIVGGGWIGFALALPGGFVIALALRGADAADTLRLRGAPLHFVALRAVRAAAPLASRRGRFAPAQVRTRGPPLPSVV